MCKESSPGLVDFAIGLVKSVPNLPDGPVDFFWGGEGGRGWGEGLGGVANSNYKRIIVINPVH